MEDLFYKGNIKLCGELQNSAILPCATPIPEWLKKALEKSIKYNLKNTEAGNGSKKF